MSKWKCDICNSTFDNYDARGFDNKIYCPLCYYKKLYKDTELERERLNNIINELFEYLKENSKQPELFESDRYYEDILDKLQELLGSDKE